VLHLAGYVVHELMCETVHSHVYRATSKADQRAVVIKLARECQADRTAHHGPPPDQSTAISVRRPAQTHGANNVVNNTSIQMRPRATS